MSVWLWCKFREKLIQYKTANKELKVTRERVRQIEAAALEELRRFVQTAGTDLYEAFRAIVGHGG